MPLKNAFAAFGLSKEDATIEAWRNDLARIIRSKFIASQKSQSDFADQIAVKQSVVSRIVRGKLRGLSVEFLLRLCVKLETSGKALWDPSAENACVTEIETCAVPWITFEHERNAVRLIFSNKIEDNSAGFLDMTMAILEQDYESDDASDISKVFVQTPSRARARAN